MSTSDAAARPAAGGAGAVAHVPLRLPGRAPPAPRLARHDGADDAARRPAGAVAQAADRRRHRRRPHGGPGRQRRARRVVRGDVDHRRAQRAVQPALPRPPVDRHGVAHRPAAGHGGDRRAPGATRVPRSPRRAPRHVVHARPPVPVAAHERGLGAAPRASRACCWRRSTRPSRCCSSPGSRRCRCRCGGPAVERAAEEAAATHDRLARHLFLVATTPGPAKEVRVTGIGSSLRPRRAVATRAVAPTDRRDALAVGAVLGRSAGRCSGSPTSPASPGSPAGSTAASATSSSSSSPASACRCTSPSR